MYANGLVVLRSFEKDSAEPEPSFFQIKSVLIGINIALNRWRGGSGLAGTANY